MAVDIRVRQGVDTVIRVQIPEPYDVTIAPVLTVHMPDGDETPALTALHPVATFSAGGVDNVARTITLDVPLASPVDVASGPDGDVFVGVSGGGAFSPRLKDVNGAVLKLAQPLPRSVAQGGVVYWATFTATLTAAAVTDSAIGSYRYTVTYSAAHAGTDAQTKRLEGVLHIDRQPWPGTGLTHHRLVSLYPQVRHLPEGASSWDAQIDMVRERLTVRLLSDLGCAEGDRLVGGNRLLNAHAYYFMEWYTLETDGEASIRYGELAERAYHEALACLSIDADDDGEIEEVKRSGVRFTGTFTSAPTRAYRGKGR